MHLRLRSFIWFGADGLTGFRQAEVVSKHMNPALHHSLISDNMFINKRFCVAKQHIKELMVDSRKHRLSAGSHEQPAFNKDKQKSYLSIPKIVLSAKIGTFIQYSCRGSKKTIYNEWGSSMKSNDVALMPRQFRYANMKNKSAFTNLWLSA